MPRSPEEGSSPKAARHTGATRTAPSPVPAGGAPPAASDEERIITAEHRRRRWLARRDVALALGTPVTLLLLWEVVARLGLIDVRLFPAPTAILMQGIELTLSGELLRDAAATIRRLAIGYGAGAAVGILAGLAMGSSRAVNAALSPTFSALYALPKIAILPLLLLIFGLGEQPKVLAVSFTIFFVLQINTLSGMRQIDPRVLEAARSYGATGWKRYRFVVLPACLPSVFTGLKVAAGLGVVVLIAVEFVASNDGLGYLIWNSWTLFQPGRMYVGLVTVALLGASLTGLITLAERLALPWQRTGSPRRPAARTNRKDTAR